jgi:hypothetical protein
VERLKYGQDISPTIENHSFELSDLVVQKYCERLRTVSIPFFVDEPRAVGCDGTWYEFAFDALRVGGSLRWWESSSPEWQSFTTIITEILAELEGLSKIQ